MMLSPCCSCIRAADGTGKAGTQDKRASERSVCLSVCRLVSSLLRLNTRRRCSVSPLLHHDSSASIHPATPSPRRYVGTAVSRLRRPCLSLRLLLYKAISSRAEVAAGSVAASSLSRVAAGPGQGGGGRFSAGLKLADGRTDRRWTTTRGAQH